MSNEDIGRTAAERFRAEHSLGTNPISDLGRLIDLPRYNPKTDIFPEQTPLQSEDPK